jgi:Putative bacterial sensory transduction regulator
MAGVFRIVLFSVALLGSVALGLVLSVQPQAASTPSGFEPDSIAKILAGLKVTDIKREIVENDPRISFRIGEVNYVADFYTCENKTRCKLLEFAVAFTRDATDTVEAVNAYNATFVFGKAAISKQDALVSTRVLNGIAGWTNEQVVAEFAGFLGATDVLLDHLKSYVVASGPSVAGGGYQQLSAQAPGVFADRSGLASRPARLARLPINRR